MAPLSAVSRRSLLTLVGFVVALACSVFVFVQLRPGLIFENTTPAGGDMGAHVWGPAFLRDNLLSSGRLSGWTPDWYAGFPAFQFYMVVPALAIVAINAGLSPWLSIPLALVVISTTMRSIRRWPDQRALILTIGLFVAIVLVPLPYGISFKLIAVLGVVSFPIAAWWMGRLAGAADPIPAFLALGAMVFLFDTNFTIYGGNIASTLAGEFAFSISLCLALVAIGWSIRSMDQNRSQASAAIVIALVALSHVIPLFFAVLSLVLLVVLGKDISRWWAVAIGLVLASMPIAYAERFSGMSTELAATGALLLLFAAGLAIEPSMRVRALWLTVTGSVGALLSFFWLVPFYLRDDYFNDMGWERLDEVGPALLTAPMRIALPIAIVGGILAFATHDRIGMLFSIHAAVFASAVANLGESRLWNARLLPFYYLSIYLLAAVGVALVARYAAVAASERFDRPDIRVIIGAMAVGLAAAIVAVGMPLRVLPFGETNSENQYVWFGLRSGERSFVSSWAAWNFSGYEEKTSYREYSSVVQTMGSIGASEGCGRAMWEYDEHLDRYGTPMALMLLPHWTDGCIGSMEGLYFESSATTPFHFLNQSALSVAPSSAQRDLPYRGFDINRGIAQLQVMGVKYYMALSDEAIAAARTHPDLTELATSEPFVVFEVGGAELVAGLDYEPVVATGPASATAGDGEELATRFETGWLSQAVEYYNDPRPFRGMPAADGPESWERVSTLIPGDGAPIDPVAVSNIVVGTDRISFDVDQIGKPVVVKTSYFPNWKVDGADGPWRIGPNQMVVVPTSTAVELSYGYTGVDYLGYGLSFLGLLGLALLVRRGRAGRGTRTDGSSSAGTTSDQQQLDLDLPGSDEPSPEDVVDPDEDDSRHLIAVGTSSDEDVAESPVHLTDP